MGSQRLERDFSPTDDRNGRSRALDETQIIEGVRITDMDFADAGISLYSAENPLSTINVSKWLKNPENFRLNGGNPEVHALVNFGRAFVPLIGRHQGDFWGTPRDELRKNGVVVLSDHFTEAEYLVRKIDRHARKVIADPSKYDDPAYCDAYYDLAKTGYNFMRKNLPEAQEGTIVQLLRAGSVSARLAEGLEKNAELPDAISVVTKRVHPNIGAYTDLAATVEWVDISQVQKMHGNIVRVPDFVNPASGASAAAMLLAARQLGSFPSEVIYYSIAATRGGIPFTREALAKLDIKTRFYSLGASESMDENYYLNGSLVVGDAGHALRHFQPRQYRSDDRSVVRSSH